MLTNQLDGVLRHIRKLADVERAETQSDAALVQAYARLGDEIAFGTLVRRHGPRAKRSPGGCRVMDLGTELRVRLPRFELLPTLVIFLIVAPPLAVFAVGLMCGIPPPLPVMVIVWAAVLGGATLLYVRLALTAKSGKADLVIDRSRRTVTLPQTFGRSQPVTLLLADVISVDVETITKTDHDGPTTHFPLLLRWSDGSTVHTGTLLDWNDEVTVRGLAAFLQSQFRLKEQKGERECTANRPSLEPR